MLLLWPHCIFASLVILPIPRNIFEESDLWRKKMKRGCNFDRCEPMVTVEIRIRIAGGEGKIMRLQELIMSFE